MGLTKDILGITAPLGFVLAVGYATCIHQHYIHQQSIKSVYEKRKETSEIPAVFCAGDIIGIRPGPDLKELESYVSTLRSLNFNCEDIQKYHHLGGTIDYATMFASAKDEKESAFSGSEIVRYFHLGLKLEEVLSFTDTPKPNAFFIYAQHDRWNPRGRGFAFYTDDDRRLFSTIRGGYDVKIVVASTEIKIYEGIKSVPSIKFLYLGGHGEESGISLASKGDEESILDINDYELAVPLQKNLDKDAVVLLDSCRTGLGGVGSNFATFVSTLIPGRTVIAAQGKFEASGLQVTSIFPFDAIIYGLDGKNITLVIPPVK